MLCDAKVTPRIEKNIIQAFKMLHSHGVCHRDVRAANVLVRKDESVVIIDFERSVLNVDKMMLLEEEDEVRYMLQFAKSRILQGSQKSDSMDSRSSVECDRFVASSPRLESEESEESGSCG